MGVGLNAASAVSWVGAAAVLAAGIALLEPARRRFAARWGETQAEIEAEIRRREAA